MEHIVISSSGPNGLIQLGMLAQLLESSYFSLDTIKSIQGTSAGSIIAVLLCIRLPIQDIIDYFIKRPLHKWLKTDVGQFMQTKGIVISGFTDLMAPLFHNQDVPLTITMKELYELTSIDLHVFTTSVTKVEAVDIHHTTFPDLSVIQAIAMSCSIPLMFPPIEYQGDYYIDGGLFMHCPLPPNEKTIVLYIKNTSTLTMDSPFHMMNHILVQSSNRLSPVVNIGERFEYATDIHGLDPGLWDKILKDESFRAEMIQCGRDYCRTLNMGASPISPL